MGVPIKKCMCQGWQHDPTKSTGFILKYHLPQQCDKKACKRWISQKLKISTNWHLSIYTIQIVIWYYFF